MTLKDNYLKLSKKLGGPYRIVKKGIEKGWIVSILQGSEIGVTKAYEISKILGVTMEELLTGKFDEKKVYTAEEQKYINKLIDILNSNDEHKKITITTVLDNLKQGPWNNNSKKSTHHVHTK